ncbi:MAG: hypothetical protein L0241_16890 [Planctomycetia bacterium]|nr:hypothetical protein [Planctomycetia bacterium]
MATDLWPDIAIDQTTRGIKQILEEAGRGLKEKTNGLVEFHVSPSLSVDPLYPFRFRCDLHVPKLAYSFSLVVVESAPNGFPVVVKSAPDIDVRIEDEAQLLAKLAEIFRSPRTQAIIQNLVAMARD